MIPQTITSLVDVCASPTSTAVMPGELVDTDISRNGINKTIVYLCEEKRKKEKKKKKEKKAKQSNIITLDHDAVV